MADARAWIERWAFSPELAELVVAFGGERADGRSLRCWLEYLDGFSERWDFRRGVERNLVACQQRAAEHSEQTLHAADVLGLRGVREPVWREYDLVVILGGLVRACLARPLHAACLLDDGTVRAERVVGLGGSRPLGGDEHGIVAKLIGEPIEDEFAAMDAGLRAAFGLEAGHVVDDDPPECLKGALAAVSYRSPDGVHVHVVAAPPVDPSRTRANTADTYTWLASQPGLARSGARLLLITTSIYVPYQHADALRMLGVPHGFEVDTVGVEPGAVDPRLKQTFAAHNYLQEIRSTVRAMRMLEDALA